MELNKDQTIQKKKRKKKELSTNNNTKMRIAFLLFLLRL